MTESRYYAPFVEVDKDHSGKMFGYKHGSIFFYEECKGGQVFKFKTSYSKYPVNAFTSDGYCVTLGDLVRNDAYNIIYQVSSFCDDYIVLESVNGWEIPVPCSGLETGFSLCLRTKKNSNKLTSDNAAPGQRVWLYVNQYRSSVFDVKDISGDIAILEANGSYFYYNVKNEDLYIEKTPRPRAIYDSFFREIVVGDTVINNLGDEFFIQSSTHDGSNASVIMSNAVSKGLLVKLDNIKGFNILNSFILSPKV